jgi:PST family polysaccharide transporter
MSADTAEPPLSSGVRRGAIWSGANVLVLRVANIAVMAIVARIVVPEQFGVFALALTVHAMVTSLAELGVGSAVARNDLDPDRIAPTVATISISFSLLLAAGMAGFADPIARLLGEPEVASPLRVLALSVALVGPFAVPGAQLQRTFQQRRLFTATAVSYVPNTIVLLVLASHGDGAMAFAWSRVVGQLVAGVIIVLSVDKRYMPGMRFSELPFLLRFGLPLAAANLLSQVLLNVDYVFIGRRLSTEDVGLYSLAFNISAWSAAVLGAMVNGVVLPAFSRVRREGGSVPAVLQRAMRTVGLVALPICTFTVALAEPLILTVYGDQWRAATPALRVLALYGVVFVIGLLLANVIIAMGRTGVLLAVQAAALVVLLPVMSVAIDLGGLVGVGAAHLTTVLICTFPAYLYAIRRSTGVGPVLLAKSLVVPVTAGVAAGAVAFVVGALPMPEPLRLLCGGIAGAALYGALTAPLIADMLPDSLVRRAPAAALSLIDRYPRALRVPQEVDTPR